MSASELVERMSTGTPSYFLPRAKSGTYAEVKSLVDLGYATVAEDRSTGRGRAVYTLTDQGREAFQEWLTEPIDGTLRLIYPDLLKIAFGHELTKSELRRRLAELTEVMGRGGPHPEWLRGQYAFPERSHYTIAITLLFTRLGRTIAEWAEEVDGEVATWRTTKLSPAAVEARERWLAAAVEALPS
jgi:DNA-binding PadR family transcriptional regulator